jgi:hypothetical protein
MCTIKFFLLYGLTDMIASGVFTQYEEKLNEEFRAKDCGGLAMLPI